MKPNFDILCQKNQAYGIATHPFNVPEESTHSRTHTHSRINTIFEYYQCVILSPPPKPPECVFLSIPIPIINRIALVIYSNEWKWQPIHERMKHKHNFQIKKLAKFCSFFLVIPGSFSFPLTPYIPLPFRTLYLYKDYHVCVCIFSVTSVPFYVFFFGCYFFACIGKCLDFRACYDGVDVQYTICIISYVHQVQYVLQM